TVENATIDRDVAKRDVGRAQIKSPLDGFVDKVELVPGQSVSVSVVLTQVLKLDPIYIRMDFPQERSREVKVGQVAEVVLDSAPKEVLHGVVKDIGPKVNPDLRVLSVVVELPNPLFGIKAGVSGYVRLHLKRMAKVLPAQAVIEQGSKSMVF